MPEFNPNTNFMEKKFSIEAVLGNLISEAIKLEAKKGYGEGSSEKKTMKERISGLKEIKASWDKLGVKNVVKLIEIATNREKKVEIGKQIDIIKKTTANNSEKAAAKKVLFGHIPQLKGIFDVFGTQIASLELSPIENEADQAFLQLLDSFVLALGVNWENLDRGWPVPNTAGVALKFADSEIQKDIAKKHLPQQTSSNYIKARLKGVSAKINLHIASYKANVSVAKDQEHAEKIKVIGAKVLNPANAIASENLSSPSVAISTELKARKIQERETYKSRRATREREAREGEAKKSETSERKREKIIENALVMNLLNDNFCTTPTKRNPIFERFHTKAFGGKDPIMTRIRENARKDELAFLQNFINVVTIDKKLSPKDKLVLVQGACQYISKTMKKETTFFTIGMELFRKMVGDLQKEIQTFQSALPKLVKENSELRRKIDVEDAMEEFKIHVRLHKDDFGVNHELTKKIIGPNVELKQDIR